MRPTPASLLAFTSLAALITLGCQPADPAEPGGGVDRAATSAEDTTDHFDRAQFNLEAEATGAVDEDDEAELAAALAGDFPDEGPPPDEAASPAEPRAAIYLLRVVWGQLRGDPGVDIVTDWSGSVQAEGAVVQILRTLRFEGRDRIIRPRPGPASFEFVSHTRPHHDGLLLRIIAPAGGEGSVTVRLGESERSYTLAELANLTELHEVGADRVLVQGMQLLDGPAAADCDDGFLAGRWRETRDDGGKFVGRWVSRDGSTHGFLFGIYGVRANGDRAFIGKYISRSGEFRGRLAGTYEPDGQGAGTFSGRWANRAGEDGGALSGRYRAGEGPHRGLLGGRWAEARCAR